MTKILRMQSNEDFVGQCTLEGRMVPQRGLGALLLPPPWYPKGIPEHCASSIREGRKEGRKEGTVCPASCTYREPLRVAWYRKRASEHYYSPLWGALRVLERGQREPRGALQGSFADTEGRMVPQRCLSVCVW